MMGEFDVSKHSLPLKEILSGGVPKDGIPAILKPKFIAAKKASFMKDKDIVLGISQGSVAKAYPIKILNHHEVVNDTILGKPIAVGY